MAKKIEETLFDLTGEYLAVKDMLEDPEVDIDTALDTLEAIEGTLEVKMDGYGQVFRTLDMDIAALDAKSKYLDSVSKAIKDHKKAIENSKKRLTDRVMASMIATGLDEKGVHTEHFDFAVKTKGGLQEMVIDGEVPNEFLKVVYENDNDRIREYLKDHTCEWAHLNPRGKRLEIK